MTDLVELPADDVLMEFAAYLREKAENSKHGAMTGEEAGYVVGMENAAVDALLFLDIREQWLRERAPDRGLNCYGCGLPYGDPGWCDVVIPTKYWIQISPNEDGSGVLCLTCMAAALEKKGLRDVPMKVTSGPWKYYPGGGGHSRTNATALMEGLIDEVKKLPQAEVDGDTYVPFKLVWILLHQRGGEWQ